MAKESNKLKIDSPKDNQKGTQKKPKPRRTNSEIMNAIFDSLERFPKSTYLVAQDTGSTPRTARKFLEIMEHRKVVKCYTDKFGRYWKLK